MTVAAPEATRPVASGAMPRVNLMPPEIAEGARLRQVQLASGLCVVLALAIVVLLYLHAHSGVSSAQSSLDQAQQEQTSLQSKLASLASVQQTFADVQAKQGLLAEAMGQEVRWSYVLNDLSLRMPSNVFLTSLAVTESTTPGTAPPAAGSAPVQIGTITFGNVGLRHDDVATWLDALAKERGFYSPLFTSSTESAAGTRGYVTFASSAELMSNLLSGRFVQTAGSS
ncbi:MAG TPA: PilN domain-containing protein [Mycobacteriales bacterium]|nr:PilN domain-containing protein [Mycobacteriales bacterium]